MLWIGGAKILHAKLLHNILHFWSYKRESWTNICICIFMYLYCIPLYTYMEHIWISDQLDFQHPYLLYMGKSKTIFWQAISFSANQSLYLGICTWFLQFPSLMNWIFCLFETWILQATLESGIDVGQRITIGPWINVGHEQNVQI